jgi:AraC-like DNA-binding protein
VRAFIEGLDRLGYDTAVLLAAAGLRQAELDDPDARLPCTAIGGLLAGAMRERPLANLAARLAAATPIGAFPLLDYLIVTSDSVGAGLQQFARYARLAGSPVRPRPDSTADPIRVVYEGDFNPFAFEFGITLCLMHLAEETEGRFVAEQVAFGHRPDDPAALEGLLRCPVNCEAGWNGWTMSRASWAQPFRRRDPILRGVLERHADALIAFLPASGPIAFEVRRVLAARIAGGDVRLAGIARVLGRSVRSLQRQLAAEGAEFATLVDETRRQAAARYLVESALPIGEVGFLLGYSEAAAFHRAFKRWTRETPDQFRRARRR